MARKNDWGKELKESTTSKPEPAASTKFSGRKTAVGTYVPEEIMAELRFLAAKESKEKDQRITISDLVSEALLDLLKKHGVEL